MDITICSSIIDMNTALNVRDKVEYDPSSNITWNQMGPYKRIYAIPCDYTDVVEVIDNRNGDAKYHKFSFHEFELYLRKLTDEASKLIYPKGERDNQK